MFGSGSKRRGWKNRVFHPAIASRMLNGKEMLCGGAGVDTVTYENSLGPIVASLLNPAVNTGEAAGDSYANIENMRCSCT